MQGRSSRNPDELIPAETAISENICIGLTGKEFNQKDILTMEATEEIDQDRRRLLGAATIGLAAAGGLLPTRLLAASPGDALRPFTVGIPEADLVDLRRRITATRWPERETVDDQSQGIQLGKLKPLVEHWGTGYDWRKAEAKLNSLPQFMTEIDGLDIHFIHVHSKHPNALPVIITHGWPGSVFENLEVIGPLTDPFAHGGRAEDAFDVVIPSMPGYGFSGAERHRLGPRPNRASLGRVDEAPRL
jgi:Epoxide hydrolase N terminus